MSANANLITVETYVQQGKQLETSFSYMGPGSTDRAKVHTTYANLKWRKRITRERCYGVRITREAFFTARMKRDYLYENLITQIIRELHNHA